MSRKARDRAVIENEIQEYLQRGGDITEVRSGTSGQREGEAMPRFMKTDKQLRENDRGNSIRSSMERSRKRGTRAANRAKQR